jgi:hypothetical protein
MGLAHIHGPTKPRSRRCIPVAISAVCFQQSGNASRSSTALSQRPFRKPVGIHSITSSARASSDGGISKPSAFAVLRLMTSSYFVGACTGKSAGFSPRRMRST